MSVQLIRGNRDLGFGLGQLQHGHDLGRAFGAASPIREFLPLRQILRCRRLAVDAPDSSLGTADNKAAVVALPSSAVPDQPIFEGGTITKVLPVLPDKSLGISQLRAGRLLLGRPKTPPSFEFIQRVGVEDWRIPCKRPQLVSGMSGIEPVGNVAAPAESGQLDDANIGDLAEQALCNIKSVPLAGHVIVRQDGDVTATERIGVLASPLAGTHWTRRGEEPAGDKPLNILLALEQEDHATVVAGDQLVEPVKQLSGSLRSVDPTAATVRAALIKALAAVLEGLDDLKLKPPLFIHVVEENVINGFCSVDRRPADNTQDFRPRLLEVTSREFHLQADHVPAAAAG